MSMVCPASLLWLSRLRLQTPRSCRVLSSIYSLVFEVQMSMRLLLCVECQCSCLVFHPVVTCYTLSLVFSFAKLAKPVPCKYQ